MTASKASKLSNNWRKWLAYLLGAVIVLSGAFFWRLSSEAKNSQKMIPPQVFDQPGIFVSCPDSPNCVSTQEDPNDSTHFLPSLVMNINPIEQIRFELSGAEGVEILQDDEFMLRGTHTSSSFGFVDDFAFFYDSDAGVLHSFSASRVGHSDLGANRKRLESILRQIK